MTQTEIKIQSDEVFNFVGALRPFSTVYRVPNPRFDAQAPRLLESGAFNPDAVATFDGKGKDWALSMVRREYRGRGTVTVVWPDGKTQQVRTWK